MDIPTPTLTESIRRLHRYGYFDTDDYNALAEGSPNEVKILEKAVSDFQSFNGLQQTGELNEDTLAKLHIARCAVPDMIMADEAVCKWPESMKDEYGITQIRVRQNIYGLNPLGQEQERAAFEEALLAINAVCGVNLFLEDENHPHISSTSGALGSGTLAISYLPCGATSQDTMDQVYNRGVVWSYVLIVQVIIHEVIHALGVSHGPSGSIMQPTASGNIMRPQAWDIDQLVKRYGPPKPNIPPPPPTGDGKLSVSQSNQIQIYAQEAGNFRLNLSAESTKVIIPSSNKIDITVTKPGTYDILLVPKISNVHI